MRVRPTGLLSLVAILCSSIAEPSQAGEAVDFNVSLKQIKAVGREGAGNETASAAWKQLVQCGPQALVPVLTALDDANPMAANWLRTAVDALAEKAIAANQFPAVELHKFIVN